MSIKLGLDQNHYSTEDIISRLQKTIRGQFIDEILKYDIFELNDKAFSFRYYLDDSAFEQLKNEILGRQIVVTNRHEWSNEKILLTYRGQFNVENAFRNLKNPHHLAIRPQYHWTDQKIEVHFLICIISYLLTVTTYSKVKKEVEYRGGINRLMEDLKTIRLTCIAKKKSKKNRQRKNRQRK